MATNKERIETNNAKIEALTTLVAQKSQGEKGLQTVKGLVENTLTSLNCADFNITTISPYKFYQNTALTNVDFTGVINIGEYAFYNCSGLTGIILADNVTSIGQRAFLKCSNSTSLRISENITKIPVFSFGELDKIINLEIPINVTTIELGGFAFCYAVSNFSYSPTKLTSIGVCAFDGMGASRNNASSDWFIFDFSNSPLTSLDQAFWSTNSSLAQCCKYYKIIFPESYTKLTGSNFGYSQYFRIFFPSTFTAITGTMEWQNSNYMHMFYKSKPTLGNTYNFNGATNFKNFFLYNDFVSMKSATNWSSSSYGIVSSIFGYAPENTFESGATLPTTDESGNALTWYDDEEITNVVTEVGEANQIYYCTQAV